MRERQLWTWHVLSGAAVFILLGAHMVVQHLDDFVGLGNPAGGSALDWANVIGRAEALGTTTAYLLLLAFALFHGFYGLRNILLEAVSRPRLARRVSQVLALFGLALFLLGSWAAIATYRLASGGLS